MVSSKIQVIIWLKRYHLTCHRKLIRMKFVVLNDEKKSIRPNGSNLNKCCASNMACYQKCLWAACQESTDSIFFFSSISIAAGQNSTGYYHGANKLKQLEHHCSRHCRCSTQSHMIVKQVIRYNLCTNK